MDNHRRLSKDISYLSIVLFVAIAANASISWYLGFERKADNDPYYYLQLARSLAEGRGYVLSDSQWPTSPTMRQMPAWPFFVSIGLRLFPEAMPDIVMRIISLSINSLIAFGIYFITLTLFNRYLVGLTAGIAYAFYPSALILSYMGCSEVLFLLFVAGGVIFIILKPQRPVFKCFGFLLLGCSCLVRANFIVFIIFMALISVWSWRMDRRHFPSRSILWMSFYVVLFLGPTFLWTLRNYTVCGHFPVVSTLRGHTFYGGNNQIVANSLDWWGYWIFPDAIPGEKTISELSETMSEYEVDEYYFEKGKQYILENWFYMPRLLLGKIIRAYVPVPFKPTWQTYIASLYRWFLYVGLIIGMLIGWRESNKVYRVCLISFALVNLLTVLVFWGYFRFAFVLETFLFPYFALGVFHVSNAFSKNINTDRCS